MESYPTYDAYRQLYATYYDGREISELLDLLEPIKGKKFLDLCCGDGRLALGAVTRGATTVDALDVSSRMIPDCVRLHHRIQTHIKGVEVGLHDFRLWGEKFDRIVCRQAVNYWLGRLTIEPLSRVISEGGVLVFNTFNEPPSVLPRVKEYEYEGRLYAEISWLVGNVVHHVQVCEGLPSHTTSFEWISPERFRQLLEPRFEVTETRDGRTSIYRCVRK